MPIVSRDGHELLSNNGLTFGRSRIYTELEVNEKNILEILENSLPIHEKNVQEMKMLIDYYLGNQDILYRQDAYSSNVNNKVVINYAQSIVRDIIGYTFGKDIEYVQRKSKDIEAVEELTNVLQYEDISLTDLTTALYASICGFGYQCTLASDDFLDETPEIGIKIGSLNPLYTFVVQSYAFKNPVVLACTYYKTDTKTTYILYDKDFVTIVENNKIISRKKHSLGGIPITMFENNEFLLGDFETATTILDALNKVASDSVNDIENFVNSLLVLVNATLGDTEEEVNETVKSVKKNRIIELKSLQNLQADAKYITPQLNPENTSKLREYLEESLWKIIGIPDRKTRGGGGGDTGDAVKLRDGWADIEVVARNKEKYFKKSKKQQLAIALNLLRKVNDKLKDLTVKDIDIKFSRNKSDNLSTKSQAYATLINTNTLNPVDALEIVDMTTNVNEVINRGEQYRLKRQEQSIEYDKKVREINGNESSSANNIVEGEEN